MLVYPKKYIDNVTKITVDFLRKNNIEAIILDLDNTLINSKRELLDGVKAWREEMKNNGIKLYMLSNTNKKKKIDKISKELNIEYINFAKKPLKGGFKKVQKILEIEDTSKIAVVRRSNFYGCNRGE